MHGMGQAKLSV